MKGEKSMKGKLINTDDKLKKKPPKEDTGYAHRLAKGEHHKGTKGRSKGGY